MITAKVICDSISPDGVRLTTLQLRYPRMIHADFMTHRVFSRNGRSSRAVPLSVLVKEEPYVPHFMKNQGGMVASEELTPEQFERACHVWETTARICQGAALQLSEIGVHKQWVNRMLEWFGYIDVLVTSTNWTNFFALRDEAGAQPEIQQLAGVMKVAMENSKPKYLQPGMWHLPYIDQNHDPLEVENYIYDKLEHEVFGSWHANKEEVLDILKKISVARCARLTIKPFDGDGSIEKELDRYNKLMVSRPVHASPAEHIATPDVLWDEDGHKKWLNQEQHGNFYGWRQFRKMIPHNTVYDR